MKKKSIDILSLANELVPIAKGFVEQLRRSNDLREREIAIELKAMAGSARKSDDFQQLLSKAFSLIQKKVEQQENVFEEAMKHGTIGPLWPPNPKKQKATKKGGK